ncbi:fructosamine kinase family protein [soil metagenome]
MSPGAHIIGAVEAALGCGVEAAAPVSGGCISAAYRVVLGDDRTIFLKTAPAGAPAGLLESEAVSLTRLAAAGAVRVPRLIAAGGSWLALEWLDSGAATTSHWQQLGGALAKLHRHAGPGYGWDRDNFIGTLAQQNGAMASWSEFWAERRLKPQAERARRRLDRGLLAMLARLVDQLDERLDGAEHDPPSLLHGDLWNGNVHMTPSGPAVIDPSAYYGHREVDLAMAALFGGFPQAFHDGYVAEWPLLAGSAGRQPIYQLYYLLVHVNLFGDSYVPRTQRALEAALR